MRLVSDANSLEYVTQSWWLASTRLHDILRWANNRNIPMRVLFAGEQVLDTLLALRLNEFSPAVAELADEAVQEMYAHRGAA